MSTVAITSPAPITGSGVRVPPEGPGRVTLTAGGPAGLPGGPSAVMVSADLAALVGCMPGLTAATDLGRMRAEWTR